MFDMKKDFVTSGKEKEWLDEDVKLAKYAPLSIANILICVEKGTLGLEEAANQIAMWGFGDYCYQSRINSIYDNNRSHFDTDKVTYSRISLNKSLHYTMVKQFRRHKTAARRILRVFRSNPYILSEDYFGGRDEMMVWINHVDHLIEMPY